MKYETLRDGLSEIINDYIEGNLDPETKRMFLTYMKNSIGLASFVKKSYEGKIILKNSYEVRAADDFEEKLAGRISTMEEKADR